MVDRRLRATVLMPGWNRFGDPHGPLEEALATAYVCNPLTFATSIPAGYKTAVVKSHLEAIKRHWRLAPVPSTPATMKKEAMLRAAPIC